MKRRSRILAMLLLLSMVLSPISLAITDIKTAEDINVETMEVEEAEETPFEFDKETGTITGYKDGNPPADLVIPDEINGVAVKHIGQNAFKDKNLKSVVLPEGLESLEYMAFQKNNLTKIELPSTLTNLGERSLAYNSLTTIDFPESLTSIGKTSLMKNKIEEIEIPSHIEEIQEGAFNSNLLTNVTLNEGLKTLGNKAFEDNSIEDIVIPDTVVNWPSTDKDNPIFRRNNKDINKKGDLILAKVYNDSGATAKNTFGIVNPASVTIEYKDVEGEDVAKSKTIVGKELKKAEKDGTAWNAPIIAVDGSGEDILNYDAKFGYDLVKVLDEISDNYYQMNKEYTFEPQEIEDYPTPEKQTVILNEKENTITFTYIKEGEEPGENQDEKYISDAIAKLKADWFKLKINSDEDKNVNTHMEDVLKEKGFEDIKVSVKSSNKEQFIDLNGDINYRYDEEYLKGGLKPTEQVALNFEFAKGKEKGQYEVRTVVGWDRDKVRQAIKTRFININIHQYNSENGNQPNTYGSGIDVNSNGIIPAHNKTANMVNINLLFIFYPPYTQLIFINYPSITYSIFNLPT